MSKSGPSVTVTVSEREGEPFYRIETTAGGRKVWQGGERRALLLLEGAAELGRLIGGAPVEATVTELRGAAGADVPF